MSNIHSSSLLVLDEPVAQQMLGNYAKENKSLEIFMCWIDVQVYLSMLYISVYTYLYIYVYIYT
jgi:hypothetical protein